MKQHNVPKSNPSASSPLPTQSRSTLQQAPSSPVPEFQSQMMSSTSPNYTDPLHMMHLHRTIGNQAIHQFMSAHNSSAQQSDKNSKQSENDTGLPNRLKAAIERLSGLSLDDVNVHYNSSEPSQFQAEAYTQGSNIYVGPGQEEHLPHEAWHVVQQKQGRVRSSLPTQGEKAAPIQFAAPGPIEHVLNSCYVAAIINTFTAVQSLKRLLLPDKNELQGAAAVLQDLLLRAVNSVDTEQTVPKNWIRNILLAFVSNGIIDNVGDSEDVNSAMGRLIGVLTNNNAEAAQDNNMPVSSGIVVWDNDQTLSQALHSTLVLQGSQLTPPNSVHINRQQHNEQAALQQFTYDNGDSPVEYRLRSVIYRDVANFGADHFVSYIDRGDDEQEWYESEDVQASVKSIDNLAAVHSIEEEAQQMNMYVDAISYIYERETIKAPEQAEPLPIVTELEEQPEQTERYNRNLIGLGSTLASEFQKFLLAKYGKVKDRQGISDQLRDLEAGQTLDSLLQNERDASSKMSTLLETGVTLEDIQVLATRTIVGKANLLKNIQEKDPGFIREVLVALDYVKTLGAENVLIQFGSAQLKDLKAMLRNYKFIETAETLQDATSEDFLNRTEDHPDGLPVGADIVIWVKNSGIGKNTFIQSKNISGGGGDWKAKIRDYVSYAAGQLSGYNLQEFSIADKGKDAFEGIALITYDVDDDLLSSEHQAQLISKIKDGLKRLHDFDFLRSEDTSSPGHPFIGRQLKYTSKVIIKVINSKQKHNTLMFDVQTQAQQECQIFSSDISSLKINSSLSRALKHNSVTEEERALADEAIDLDKRFSNDLIEFLFTTCHSEICEQRSYGEVFNEHFLAGIAQFGIEKFISRFEQYAFLAFLKQKEVDKRGKSQKIKTEEIALDSLLRLFSSEYSQDRDPDLTKREPKKKVQPSKGRRNARKKKETQEPEQTPLEQIMENLSIIGNPSSSEYVIDYETDYSLSEAIDWRTLMEAIGVTIVGLTDKSDEEESD